MIIVPRYLHEHYTKASTHPGHGTVRQHHSMRSSIKYRINRCVCVAFIHRVLLILRSHCICINIVCCRLTSSKMLVIFLLLFSCHVQLFVTPWTAACQTFLSFTTSQSCSNSCPMALFKSKPSDWVAERAQPSKCGENTIYRQKSPWRTKEIITKVT